MPSLPGTLDTAEDSLKLTVWTPQDVSVEEFVRGIVAQQEEEVPQTIMGIDENNQPVTLFGCGLAAANMAQGFRQWDIHAVAAIRGFEIENWQHPFVESFMIKPVLLHRWFGRKLLNVESTVEAVSFICEKPIDLEFRIESGVTIRLAECTTSNVGLDEVKFAHDGQIWFHFDNVRSLDEITERWIPWISRLLGLLMGVPCRIGDISVFTYDPYNPNSGPPIEGTIIRPVRNTHRASESDPLPKNMIVTFQEIQEHLPSVFAEWNRVCTHFEPVVALFSAVALYHSLHQEARFLFLVQALEIYYSCRLRCSSTEPSKEYQKSSLETQCHLPFRLKEGARGKSALKAQPLAKKLADIFNAHQVESKQLLDDYCVMADRIAYTRNHLTHHASVANSDRLIPDAVIGAVSLKLEAILWIIILREIGLDGTCVRRVVKKVADLRIIRC